MVRVESGGGAFTLDFGSNTTEPIFAEDSDAEIQRKIRALQTAWSVNISVRTLSTTSTTPTMTTTMGALRGVPVKRRITLTVASLRGYRVGGWSGITNTPLACVDCNLPRLMPSTSKVQELICAATSGSFSLAFGDDLTAPIVYNDTRETLRAKIAALDTVFDVTVTIPANEGSSSSASRRDRVCSPLTSGNDGETTETSGNAAVYITFGATAYSDAMLPLLRPVTTSLAPYALISPTATGVDAEATSNTPSSSSIDPGHIASSTASVRVRRYALRGFVHASGSRSAPAVNGIARFNQAPLAIDRACGSVQLEVASRTSQFRPLLSHVFSVNAGIPAALVLQQQPWGGYEGDALFIEPIIVVVDAGGNVVTWLQQSGIVHVTASNSGSDNIPLVGPSSSSVRNGVASFDGRGFGIAERGEGIKLTFVLLPGGLRVSSQSFTVSPRVASALVLVHQPSEIPAIRGERQFKVQVQALSNHGTPIRAAVDASVAVALLGNPLCPHACARLNVSNATVRLQLFCSPFFLFFYIHTPFLLL